MAAERCYRILIVDDEDAVVRFVERALSDAGYQAATARSGHEAIDIAAREAAFDLLLTDLMMPGINGDELARHLRRADPDLNVLYLTGHSDQLFRDKRMSWDREAFLHSDRGTQCLSMRDTNRLADAGIAPSVGSRGDSFDNALAESIIGLFKTEVIRRPGPWRHLEAVKFATLDWVDWFNHRRLLEPIGYVPPAEYEARYYEQAAVA